jgi:hypothetical protein
MTAPKRIDIEQLIDAARAHGEDSEADHEVGDLQEVLRACWSQMTHAARACVASKFSGLVNDWGPEPDGDAFLDGRGEP